MGQPSEQCRGHPGIAEDSGPFTEAHIGDDGDTGAFIELAEQMEVHTRRLEARMHFNAPQEGRSLHQLRCAFK